MNIVLNKINHILMEKYLKLQDTCRTQVRRKEVFSPASLLPHQPGRGRFGAEGLGSSRYWWSSVAPCEGLAFGRETWRRSPAEAATVFGSGVRGEAVAKAALISPSAQLVWLLRELVKSGVLGADGVCMTFMKQIAGE